MKTISLKKVSAVAVASLGFGLLSVVPANAAAADADLTYNFTATGSTATPTAGTAVVVPITLTVANGEAATGIISAELTTLPTNSALDAQGATTASATAANSLDAAKMTTAATAATASAGAYLTHTWASDASESATAAGSFGFTPDTAGKYVMTLTTGTGTSTDEFTTAGSGTTSITVEIIVGGASLVQAASGLGTGAGTQTVGNQSAVAVWLPAASDTTSRYSVTATGATIVGAFVGATVTDAVTANTYTSTTGITKNNGVDYGTGFTLAGARTVTAVTLTGDASDSLIVQMTSAVASTATLTVKSINATTGVTTTVYTATVTYGATPDLSFGLSTAYMTAPSSGGSSASSTTNAVARSASKVLQTGIAQVKVTLLKTDGTTDARAHTVTATVAGSGMVLVNTTADTPGTGTRTSNDSSTNNIRYVHINADGTAGTGTITVSVTHAVTGVTTVMKTFTVTSYGDATKIVVEKSNFKVGKASTETGKAATTRNEAGEVTNAGALNASTTTPAFIIKATDANGNVAALGNVPTIVSGALTVIASGSCVLDDGGSTTYSSSTLGFGYYNCSFTGASTAKSGDKATLTIRITDPADSTLYLTTTYDVTIGGSVSTETLSFDKTSYAAGEAMVITRTAKDSSGNPVADGTTAPALSFSKAVGGTATPAAKTYIAGVSATSTSAATAATFAPVTPGAFSVIATSSATGAPTITASATVTDANAGLLTQIDALNAKIVALNALIAKIMKKLGVK